MLQLTEHPIFRNQHLLFSSEADQIIDSLRAMKRGVIDAWKERAVVLTREEQRRLRDEIRDTCELLQNLTASV